MTNHDSPARKKQQQQIQKQQRDMGVEDLSKKEVAAIKAQLLILVSRLEHLVKEMNNKSAVA
jgi:hypothetical protein